MSTTPPISAELGIEALSHFDETGAPCRRHPATRYDGLLALAFSGSRVQGFNHDIASKLQGLMMTLDELAELVEARDDAELRRVTESASAALGELNQLLAGNRALTRPGSRTRAPIGELMKRASERVGVKLRGELGQATCEGSVPALTHALSLAMDVAGGPGRGRVVDIAIRPDTAAPRIGAVPTLTIQLATAPASAPNAGELLAIARWVLRRETGELTCTPSGEHILVRMPVI